MKQGTSKAFGPLPKLSQQQVERLDILMSSFTIPRFIWASENIAINGRFGKLNMQGAFCQFQLYQKTNIYS